VRRGRWERDPNPLPTPLTRAQAPDDLFDPAPGHDVVDPVYTD